MAWAHGTPPRSPPSNEREFAIRQAWAAGQETCAVAGRPPDASQIENVSGRPMRPRQRAPLCAAGMSHAGQGRAASTIGRACVSGMKLDAAPPPLGPSTVKQSTTACRRPSRLSLCALILPGLPWPCAIPASSDGCMAAGNIRPASRVGVRTPTHRSPHSPAQWWWAAVGTALVVHHSWCGAFVSREGCLGCCNGAVEGANGRRGASPGVVVGFRDSRRLESPR